MFKFIRYITSRKKIHYLIALGYMVITLFFLIAESHEKTNIIPKMRKNHAHGWHISSTINALPTTKISDGFDDNFETVFHSSRFQAHGSLTLEAPQNHVVSQFKISPQTSLTSRCPKDISLSASKNGNDWVMLGRFNKISFDGLMAGDFKTFNVAINDNYRFFRFDLNGNDEYLTFSELQLISQEYNINIFKYLWLLCMSILMVFCLDLTKKGDGNCT